jgi:putative ABC transport system permease protein
MIHVLAMFLREWPFRVASLVVPVVGAAGATFILVSMLAISNGISDATQRGGDDDVAIVLQRDAQIETSSRLSDDEVATIVNTLSTTPSRVISPELVQTVDTVSRGGEAGAQVLARGISASGIPLRRSFRVVAGRLFTPGRLEVIVGRRLARDFAGLEPGGTLTGSTHEWSIVGVFEEGGGTGESEVWMDLDSARTESGSRAPVSSLRVHPLAEPDLSLFRETVRSSPQRDVGEHPARHLPRGHPDGACGDRPHYLRRQTASWNALTTC